MEAEDIREGKVESARGWREENEKCGDNFVKREADDEEEKGGRWRNIMKEEVVDKVRTGAKRELCERCMTQATRRWKLNGRWTAIKRYNERSGVVVICTVRQLIRENG